MPVHNDSYNRNRQMLDAAMLDLAEDLRAPVGSLMRSATASGSWSLEDLPEGLRGQVVSVDDVAGSRDLTLLLGIVLGAWEPVFSQPFGEFGVTYQLVDKVRHVRNDYAHVSADFADESYVADARQAIANLRECVVKWSQEQGFVVVAVDQVRTQASVAQVSPAQQHYQIGLEYYNQRQFDLAIANFNRAISLDRNHIAAYNDRGRSFVEVRRYKDAVSDFRRVTNMSPDWAIGWNNLGWAYDMGGSYNSAVSAYESAIALDPQCLVAWNNMGRMLFRQGGSGMRVSRDGDVHLGRCVQVMSRGIAANPGAAELYSGRAAALYALRRFDDAMADVDYALTLHPGEERLLQIRGEFVRLGRKRKLGRRFWIGFVVMIGLATVVFYLVGFLLDAE